MDKSLYLYCVVAGTRDETLDMKGIGGESVFTVASDGICAVVQECDNNFFSKGNNQARSAVDGEAPSGLARGGGDVSPYEDPKLISEWILSHQAVVDLAWERYETVVPFSFDTIVIAKEEKSARENLLDWLEKEKDALKGKIERFRGKAEYGIQILWDPTLIAPRVTKNDAEVQKLEDEIRSKSSSQSSGTAYLLGQKLEKLLSQRMEQAADIYFKEFFQKIRGQVEEIQVGKVKKEETPRQMLANLSCLLPKEDVPKLGSQLDGIGKIEGFFVRFTGPWPPYSFVNG